MKTIKLTKLHFGYKANGGRNNYGKLTIAQNALTKKNYRFIDTKRIIYPGIGATILRSQPDPNRCGLITALLYPNAVVTYVLGAQLASNQTKIYNLYEPSFQYEKGWSNFLRFFPLGAIIHNIEIIPGQGGQLMRSAGNSAVVLKKSTKNILIKLKSGAQRLFHPNCIAVNGIVSNPNHFLRNLKKAGTSRLLGKRPHVRACSKNPVDHPLGGRTRGGMQPQNKNGLQTRTPTGKIRKHHHLEVFSARKKRLK
jgi:large subunit ribosomal protein L2